MSSIKKFVKESNEWIKFSDTTNNLSSLSSATNVYVDFSSESSLSAKIDNTKTVNDVLIDQELEIQKLKRNVSWLALHGGGGSGTGSGGSTTTNATAKIRICDAETREKQFKTNGYLEVELYNIKPNSDTTENWTITVYIDDDQILSKNYAKSDSTENGTIYLTGRSGAELPAHYEEALSWEQIEQYFIDKGVYHTVKVFAEFNNSTTGICTQQPLSQTINLYIPSVDGSVTAHDIIDVSKTIQEYPDNTLLLSCKTTATGNIQLSTFVTHIDTSTDISYNYGVTYKDEFNNPFISACNILCALLKNDTISAGFYNFNATAQFKSDGGSWEELDGNISNKKILCINSTKDDSLFLNFINVSQNSENPTLIESNTKEVRINCIAYDNRGSSNQFNYVIQLKKKDTEDIIYLTSGSEKFQNEFSFNNYVPTITEGSEYIVQVTINYKDELIKTFEAYMKCSKSAKDFIVYSDSATNNLILSFNPQKHQFGTFANGTYYTSAECSVTVNSGTTEAYTNISSTITISDINGRSGLREDTYANNCKLIRMYDSHIDINPTFATNSSIDDLKQVSIKKLPQFTICLSFKTTKYYTSDYIIFSLLDSKDESKGICIKSNGIYVGGVNKCVLISDKITTVHFVYYTPYTFGPSVDPAWTMDGKSYYKIYVDGILVYADNGNAAPIDMASDTISMQLNGLYFGNTKKNTCNVDIYGFELFQCALNELDIFGTTLNNTLRSTYNEKQAPAFELIDSITKQNGCTQLENGKLSSDIYELKDGKLKYTFKNFLTTRTETTTEGKTIQKDYVPNINDKPLNVWLNGVSSLNLPVIYIDLLESKNTTESHEWTFEKFVNTGHDAIQWKDFKPAATFYYWDPSTNTMPISSNNVRVHTQGTSTLGYQMKNVQVNFEYDGQEDLFFVNERLIPESTYLLKADVVDSSHANNASIGKLINDVFNIDDTNENKDFFVFDPSDSANPSICKKNMDKTRSWFETQKWNITPTLKHTVEGTQTLLFIRFGDKTQFTCCGIYSLNIGRSAARNLGFNAITNITQNNETITGLSAPAIIPNVTVKYEDNAHTIGWIENSDTQNFNQITSWTTETSCILSTDSANPPGQCRFWHTQHSEIPNDAMFKNGNAFELKVTTDDSLTNPSDFEDFTSFVDEVSHLAVEGLSYVDSSSNCIQHEITGNYQAYYYDESKSGDDCWQKAPGLAHKLSVPDSSGESSNYGHVDVLHCIRYYLIAILFGLVDNLDKNMSIRVFKGKKPAIDFYDLDTAFGLNNKGKEIVTPTVGLKQVINNHGNNDIDQVVETYDTAKITENKQYESIYSQYVSDNYTNKLWISLDTKTFRTKVFNYAENESIYSSNWFDLRDRLDQIATKNGYTDFVEYFCEEYFNKQIKFGSMIYNYDYIMKYLNDHSQQGQIYTSEELYFMHGVRKDYVKKWFREHVDFLDSYFFWRGNGKYKINLTTPALSYNKPEHLITKLGDTVNISRAGSSSKQPIQTIYPVIIRSYATAEGVQNGAGSTTLVHNQYYQSGKGSGGGADKQMSISEVTLLKNIILTGELSTNYFAATESEYSSYKLSTLEELDLTGLKNITINFNNYYSNGVKSSLNSLKFKNTTFANTINLDLQTDSLLNISYVDLYNCKNIANLKTYDTNKEVQHFKYLDVTSSDINELFVVNQNMLKLPNVNYCEKLEKMTLKNWTLESIPDASLIQDYYGNIDIKNNDVFESLTLDNVIQVKKINLLSCGIQTIDLQKLSSLESITIKNCQSLTSLNIVGCPKLTSILVNDCYKLPNIYVLSNCTLANLDLDYDTNISAIYLTQSDVKNITDINIRNVDISGFNFYLSGDIYTKQGIKFNDITVDPLGQKVLDFKDFDNLNENGLIILGARNTAKSADKADNFAAIRYPNNKLHAYNIQLNDQYHVHFNNLSNIYGHIRVSEDTCYNESNYPRNGFFLDCTSAEYYAMPKFIKDTDVTSFTKLSTIFDALEQKTALSTVLTSDSLYDLINAGYLKDGFISSETVDEFDSREWATNITMNKDISRAFYNRNVDGLLWQYMLFRYAIAVRQEQINGNILGFHSFGRCHGKESTRTTAYTIPKNTFRYFGNTIGDIVQLFNNGKFQLTRHIMSKFKQATRYASVGSFDLVSCDAINVMTTLQMLGDDSGNIYNEGYNISDCVQVSADEKHVFFDGLSNVNKIINFSPKNMPLEEYVMPSSVTTIQKSFLNLTNNDVVDAKSLLSSCNQLNTLEDSFGKSHVLYKTDTYKFAKDALSSISYNTPCIKDFVKDSVTAKEFKENNCSCSEDTLTQDEFLQIANSLISANTTLKSAKQLYGYGRIPYSNGNTISVKLGTDMFTHNSELTNISYLFKNAQFKYELQSKMFSPLTNLKNVEGAFMCDEPSEYGIVSEIPYQLFWTGDSEDETKTFVGTNRFDETLAPQSFSEFTTKFDKTYYPQSLVKGSYSYSFDELSTELSNSGILNPTSYQVIKDTILSDITPVELTALDVLKANYASCCPIASVDNMGNVEYDNSDNGINLRCTLSTIYDSLKQLDNWKQKLCGIGDPIEHTIKTFNCPITNVDYCFAGNPNIKPYSGNRIEEPNPFYSPYLWNYDEASKSLIFNENFNDKMSSDIYSNNGKIWDITGEYPYTFTQNSNYVASCDTLTDPTMSAITDCDISDLNKCVYRVEIAGTQYVLVELPNYFNVIHKKSTYLNGTTGIDVKWPLYIMNISQQMEFSYICSPDLLRYCNKDLTHITGLFKQCDMRSAVNTTTIAERNNSSTNNVFKYNVGLTGRIPACLLWPLEKIESASALFQGCFHITSYKKQTENGIKTYLIPETFFKYIPNITACEYLFSHMFINYDADLATPFTYLSTNSSKNIHGIFAFCIWRNSGQINQIFNTLALNDIDSAFRSYYENNAYNSLNDTSFLYTFDKSGFIIGTAPTFNVFTDKNKIPSSNTATYYRDNGKIISDSDYAWNTMEDTRPHAPERRTT